MAVKDNAVDWRPKCETSSEMWMEAKNRGFYTDVEFLVGQKESAKSFSAHKLVLAINSPVFETMFYGSLAEQKMPITVTDIDPKGFDILIRFMYQQTITFSTFLEACEAYLAAQKYLVELLNQLAESYILKAVLDDDTFWEITNKECLLIPAARHKYLHHFASHAAELADCNLFLNLPAGIIDSIVQLNELEIEEYELLNAVVRWSMANVKPGMDAKTLLSCPFQHIRFSRLSLDEFCTFLDRQPGLIDIEDAMQIMKHIFKPKCYKLPPWCSTLNADRM